MCTIFFLSPWNKKSSFVFSFHFVQIRNKTSRKRKEKKKMNLTPNDCWTTSSVPTWKESQFLKHKNSPTQLKWKKIKIFFPSLFSLSSNRKNQMLATTWLGSILSLTKKATQNKNARLSFFHVPSQTNCFSNTYQTRTKAENLTRPKPN